ncbi:MAG TPA: hypothetical protein VKV40_20060 [Ktedonobacteraceae bacterium]|nr:hypothetical protein [Ktedonobacteraceae bacterium]
MDLITASTFLISQVLVRAGDRIWRIIRATQFMLQDHIENLLPPIQVSMLVTRGPRDSIVSRRRAEESTALTRITRSFIFRACLSVYKDVA